MQDLYSGFKKVSEDDRSAVLQHDNGHKLNIAKSGLNKKQVAMLKKLPLYQAQGTQIPEEVEKPEEEAGKAVGKQIASNVFENVLKGVEEAASSTKMFEQQPTSTKIPTEELVQRPIPQSPKIDTSAPIMQYKPGSRTISEDKPIGPSDILNKFFSAGMGGKTWEQLQEIVEQERKQELEKKARAVMSDQESALATQQQPTPGATEAQPTPAGLPATAAATATAPTAAVTPKAEEPSALVSPTPVADQAQEFLNRAIETQQRIVQEDDEFYREMRDPKNEIKPVDLFTNKDVFGSIGTIAGLLISGIGAGLAGTENMAMNYLNKQIDREVEAQKANRERKFNLYKMHRESLKDDAAASLQTATNLKQVALMRMEEMMGLLGGNKMAQLKLEAYANDLKSQIAEGQAKQAQLITDKQVRQSFMPASKEQLIPADPTQGLRLIKDEKLAREVSNEITRRKEINKTAPRLVQKMNAAFDDLQAAGGLGVLAAKVKQPESFKDLEQEIVGFFKEQAGETEGAKAQRETDKIRALKLLMPDKSVLDLGDRAKYLRRIGEWAQQNISTPATDLAREKFSIPGLDLNKFEATAIDPSKWGTEIADVDMLLPTGDVIKVPASNVEKAKTKFNAVVVKK